MVWIILPLWTLQVNSDFLVCKEKQARIQTLINSEIKLAYTRAKSVN